jgi:hypothetical protein
VSEAAPGGTSAPPRTPSRGRTALRGAGLLAAVAPLLLGSPVALGAAVGSPAVPVERAAPAAPTDTTDPLDVSIDALSPAAVPQRGPLTIRGTVTNDSIETWSGVQVYGVPSPNPMTTSAELAEAAASPADAFLGERITEEFAELGDLAPGTTRAFQLRLPRGLLPDAGDGVYWMGVQALGANAEGRDEIADGRARTFLPLVSDDGTDDGRTDAERTLDAALVLPLRHPVRRDGFGRVRNLASWADALSPGGRLDRLLDFGAEADATDAEVTWLLDPAVADTVGEVVAGNAGLTIDPTTGPGAGEDRGPDDEADTTPDPDGATAGPDAEDPQEDRPAATRAPALDPEDAELQRRAASQGADWLQQLRTVLDASAVLALPYGDLDVDAVARAGGGLLDDARTRSDEVTRQQGLEDAVPVVAPPNGLLDASTLDSVAEGETVLVADSALAVADPGTVTRVAGRDLVVASSAAATGGPDPDDPLSPIALRQRLVAEAAVRLLGSGSGSRDATLVVTVPPTFTPQPGTGFFRELDRLDWLDLTGLEDLVAGSRTARQRSPDLAADTVRYPAAVQAREVPASAVVDGQQTLESAATLQDVLPLNTDVAQQVLDQVLTGLAHANRAAPQRAGRAVSLPVADAVQRQRRLLRAAAERPRPAGRRPVACPHRRRPAGPCAVRDRGGPRLRGDRPDDGVRRTPRHLQRRGRDHRLRGPPRRGRRHHAGALRSDRRRDLGRPRGRCHAALRHHRPAPGAAGRRRPPGGRVRCL